MDSVNLFRATVDNEGTYGVGDGTPTPIPLTNDSTPEIVADEDSIPDYGDSLAEPKSFYSRKRFRVPVKFYLKGAAGAGTVPEWVKLMKAWGLSSTATPATNVVLSPVNTGHPSVTLLTNLNNVDWIAKGLRGTSMTIPFIAGKRVIVEGVGESRYTRPTVQAYSAPTFADAAISAPLVQSMGVQINGVSYVIPEVRLVMENVTETIENVNAAFDGIESIDIQVRKWYFDIPVVRQAQNDVEWFALWEDSTEFALTSTGFGPSGGGRIQVDCQKLQIASIRNAPYKNNHAYTVRCKILKGTTVANEFSLTMD